MTVPPGVRRQEDMERWALELREWSRDPVVPDDLKGQFSALLLHVLSTYRVLGHTMRDRAREKQERALTLAEREVLDAVREVPSNMLTANVAAALVAVDRVAGEPPWRTFAGTWSPLDGDFFDVACSCGDTVAVHIDGDPVECGDCGRAYRVTSRVETRSADDAEEDDKP
jgi:hypothetical protein